MNWIVHQEPHGLFLSHGSFCVARLDKVVPEHLSAIISQHASVLKERNDAIETVRTQGARIAELEAALRQIAEWAESAIKEQERVKDSDSFPAVLMATPVGNFARAALAKGAK